MKPGDDVMIPLGLTNSSEETQKFYASSVQRSLANRVKRHTNEQYRFEREGPYLRVWRLT